MSGWLYSLMLRGFFPLDNYLLYWVSVHCKLWGVDTLKNEGRCSHSPVQGVDTLENEGIYIVRVRG